jgi:hypothetical protein
VRSQLHLYQNLGILTENAKAALAIFSQVPDEQPQILPQVILFTGHRIDAEGRPTPRFPAKKEAQARTMILEAVAQVKEKAQGPLLGISGGASGGDILFHEVCEELGIPTKMYLAVPKSDYVRRSVADGGADWVNRFNRLYHHLQPEILLESTELPRWLRAKSAYSIWQRSNLWMLYTALTVSQENVTLMALWNGAVGDGPGGTADMITRAQERGATFIHLDARKLLT